jgi:molecular chaperone HscB
VKVQAATTARQDRQMSNPSAAATARQTAGSCWSCGAPGMAGGLFCTACQTIQPPGQSGHFERLGLAEDFDVDLANLDRRYFDLQRQLHPDRFARRTAREKAVSQQQAATLNEAYETLRNPLQRARYLAQRRGVDLPEEGRTIDDAELLMEAMEKREALANAATPDAVAHLAAKAQTERLALLGDLTAMFAATDRPALRAAILRLTYLEKFAEEARTRHLSLLDGAAGR